MNSPVFFHVRLTRGGEISDLMSIIERFTPVAQALPPSAAVAQVGGALRLFDASPVELALRLRLQAVAWYGLDAAVGIASSWPVAAMASVRAETHGVRFVPPSETTTFLSPLPVGELYGIRRQQAALLQRVGVETIGQLAKLPSATVLRVLGRAGRALQERAYGVDHRAITPGSSPRSSSVRADFARDALDGDEVRAAAERLVTELGARLRSQQRATRAVTVVVRMADGHDLSKTRTLRAPSGHTDDLRAAVCAVLNGFGLQRARIRRLTLVAEQVVDAGQAHTQLALDQTRASWLHLEPVIDQLNARFGAGTVAHAAAATLRPRRRG
ncbi:MULTISPECIES: hypothetical protein [unclassified Streptomyces]|uniref:DNA polymerase Y family protein n=1 Tax=unclassified Streptomyces TaxID=2593676 RepID=UPI002E18B31D|nr:MULTISPECIES: hypothetical protein [unclassified Streptomyces]